VWSHARGTSLDEIRGWSAGDLLSAAAQLRIDDLIEAAAIDAARSKA
jgi:hypothetical protein